MAIGVLLAWEWSSMVPSSRQNAFAIAYTVPAVLSSMVPFPGIIWGTVVLVCWLTAIWLARHEEHKYLLMLGVPYIAIGAGSINWLYEFGGFADLHVEPREAGIEARFDAAADGVRFTVGFHVFVAQAVA